ncbi:MAG: twin-arginine translocation pathway signal protein [Burkholderiaceae bacterium]|nr:twin-arginine translocation pathway signal protein [Burkholderiaceae bacterium]MBP6815528.1 twin-arginine translocation pathway signal protein [Burkholderiaceae bacterium]MBP7661521.1 twin-arginine translocation pathway signal protein [Burkholderiaceae bacterium]
MLADPLRRRLMLKLSALALPLAGQGTAIAQARPDAVRVLCGYPPGGASDSIARRLAERIAGGYARVAVVDNKPGAAGRLAVEELRKGPADGSTLLITPASVVTMYPHVYRQLSYDVFTDLAPVAVVASTAFALAVGPKVPASVQSLDDFAKWCKANPALAQCGNAGAGSMPHFMAMLLGRETGIDLIHIPYRGGPAAMQDAAAGQISAALATEGSALSLEQAGKLRVLATTAAKRSAFFPNAATFESLGYRHLTRSEWFGAFMQGRTRPDIAARMSEALGAAVQELDIREAWHKLSLSPATSTPAELQAMVRAEHDFWGPLVKASGFTPEA